MEEEITFKGDSIDRPDEELHEKHCWQSNKVAHSGKKTSAILSLASSDFSNS